MYDQLLQQIGNRIRERRKQLRMTQEELGGDVLTKSAVSQIELGKVVPSIETLAYIADRLGRPMSFFLEDRYFDFPSPIDDAAREAGIDPDQARSFLMALIRRL